jgi:hypothetical protein
MFHLFLPAARRPADPSGRPAVNAYSLFAHAQIAVNLEQMRIRMRLSETSAGFSVCTAFAAPVGANY